MTLLTKIKQLYRPLTNWAEQHTPYSYSIFISVFILGACCFWLLLTNNSINQKILSAENNYGQQVAQMAADKLSQATANGDLISMQAELNGLTQINMIDNAIIYDLNNRVKVQAGAPKERLDTQHIYLIFSAPISQDETVIGQLTITARSTYSANYSNTITAIIIWGGLTLLLLCFSKIKIAIHKPVAVTPPQEDIPAFVANAPTETTITLLLQLKNIDSVFQQLSKEVREEKFSAIKRTIDKVLKLYSGQLKAIDTHSLFITISDHDKAQAVLNALCCAELIQKMASEEQWLIKTNAIIYTTDDEIKNSTDHYSLMMTLQYIKNHSSFGVFIDEQLAQIAQSRITTQTPSKKISGFYEVEAFSEKYTKLLENQCNHLRQI